jgi:hypothetical protein
VGSDWQANKILFTYKKVNEISVRKIKSLYTGKSNVKNKKFAAGVL